MKRLNYRCDENPYSLFFPQKNIWIPLILSKANPDILHKWILIIIIIIIFHLKQIFYLFLFKKKCKSSCSRFGFLSLSLSIFRNKRFEIDLLVKSCINFFFLFLICAIVIVHTCVSWADMIFRIECDFRNKRFEIDLLVKSSIHFFFLIFDLCCCDCAYMCVLGWYDF